MAARRIAALVLGLIVSATIAAPASAATIVGCGPDGASCSWSIEVDGSPVMSGTYNVDTTTGEVSLPQSVSGVGPNGESFSIDGLSGNTDPILGFAVGAGTGAVGSTFAFNLNLPISISGPIFADSSASYTLTSLTAAGAQIAPFLGPNVVIATEVDTSIGGQLAFNKGVDIGTTFFFIGGPQTQNSPVYTATNNFVTTTDYDTMAVTVAFALSPNANVGISGFVQQVEVPEPGMLALLVVGMTVVATRRRRS